jgi:putative transposase
VSERYELIDAEKDTMAENGERKYKITQMCGWLEVSTSGFYEWRGRPVSATASRRAQLAAAVRRIFTDSDETYGHRRIHAQLAREGQRCTPELVRAVMRDLGLVACQPRPWRHCLTDGDPAAALPDLVRRDFTAVVPGQKLVGDITYIPTWEGWAYLATVIDCCTKEVIGWAMDDNYKTPLIEAAIHMAARNHDLVPDAIFHSDRGSNYTSERFANTLEALGIRQSVGRTGICYDNALAESFFGMLKTERVNRTVYPTRRHAERDIASYIELHYNTQRLHSGLGYRTPREVRDQYLNGQLVA